MRLTAAVLVLAALLTACSDDGAGDADGGGTGSTPTTSTPRPSQTPTPALPLPELTTTGTAGFDVAAQPAWTSDGISGPKTIEVLGDLAVVGTPRDQRAVDLTTGETLWTLDDDDDLPLPGTTSAGGLVLAPSATGPRAVASFYANGCAFGCPVPDAYHSEQKGVVALDARTGDVAWGQGLVGSAQADYLEPPDREGDLVVTIPLTSPRVLVAAVGDGDVVLSQDLDADLPVYAVALDPATGERLWARRGVVPEAVVGDLVIGRVNDADTPVLVALDARTGERRWRSTVASPFLALESVSPRVIVVDDDRGTTLVDTATGEPFTERPPGDVRFCAEWVSGPVDVACAWSPPDDPLALRLLTLGVDAGMSLSAVPLEGAPDRLVDGVVVTDEIDRAPTRFVDAAGRPVAPERPDRLVSLDERYLVVGTEVRSGNELRSITVLRRR